MQMQYYKSKMDDSVWRLAHFGNATSSYGPTILIWKKIRTKDWDIRNKVVSERERERERERAEIYWLNQIRWVRTSESDGSLQCTLVFRVWTIVQGSPCIFVRFKDVAGEKRRSFFYPLWLLQFAGDRIEPRFVFSLFTLNTTPFSPKQIDAWAYLVG